MVERNIMTILHKQTKRDYVQRVVEHDKGECAEIAKKWGFDYWDGDRKYGFGGYSYDGRWKPVAEEFIKAYDLKAGDSVLDVGCGKAFLLCELKKLIPELNVTGIDVSEYGIKDAPENVRDFLQVASADSLPFEEGSFDLVLSINTFHNLYNFQLFKAFQEMERVGRKHRYMCAESYRNEKEKANLLYWQLTCETFYTPQEWKWFADQAGYSGDFDFIYFE